MSDLALLQGYERTGGPAAVSMVEDLNRFWRGGSRQATTHDTFLHTCVLHRVLAAG